VTEETAFFPLSTYFSTCFPFYSWYRAYCLFDILMCFEFKVAIVIITVGPTSFLKRQRNFWCGDPQSESGSKRAT